MIHNECPCSNLLYSKVLYFSSSFSRPILHIASCLHSENVYFSYYDWQLFLKDIASVAVSRAQ